MDSRYSDLWRGGSGGATTAPRRRETAQARRARARRRCWKPRRVAVSRDLGLPPVDPRVADLVMAAARRLEAEGVIVEEAHPDLRETRECAQTLRALSYANMAPLLERHRDLLKPEVVWNIEKGLTITGDSAEIRYPPTSSSTPARRPMPYTGGRSRRDSSITR